MKKHNKILGIFLATCMLMSMASAASATSNAVTVSIPADGTSNTYWTLSDAIQAIPNGKNANITINESLTETNAVTIAPASASSIQINALVHTTIKTPLIVSGGADVSIGLATFDTSGVAITVNSPASLTLKNGSVIKGSTTGIRNQGGTVSFQPGNQVSDYTHISGTVTGSWNTPSPSPSTSASPSPTGVVSVTGISGVPATQTLKPNTISKLNPTVLPSNASDKRVTYRSSNTSVVTVSAEGYITARANGVAVVTAKTVDGGFEANSIVTVSATATPSPSPTTSPKPTVDAPVYIARNALVTVANKKVSSVTTKSSTRVTRRPLTHQATSINQLAVPVVAFTYMDKQDYDCLRYDLPWLKIDIYPEAREDLRDNQKLTVGVRRITPSGTMKTQWNKIKSKNVTGPWDVTSNSNTNGFMYRFQLPSLIYKNSLKLVKWNGSTFAEVDRNDWTVIKLSGKYYVRTDLFGDGIYALMRK